MQAVVMDQIEVAGRPVSQVEQELQVGMVLLEPRLRDHADVRPCGLAEEWPDGSKLVNAEIWVASGTGKDSHHMPSALQRPGQRPGMHFEAPGEWLADRKARRCDQCDAQRAHRSSSS